MTTSRNKAAGSAQERAIARLLGGERVGQMGGPVDVVLPGYANVQVKNLKSMPSLKSMHDMLEAMPATEDGQPRLRAVVVVERAGSGRRGVRTITFALDDWAEWHVA